jgi:hypothetical protein
MQVTVLHGWHIPLTHPNPEQHEVVALHADGLLQDMQLLLISTQHSLVAFQPTAPDGQQPSVPHAVSEGHAQPPISGIGHEILV